MNGKFALAVAQALVIGGILWLLSGVSELKSKVAVLEVQRCRCRDMVKIPEKSGEER